MKEEGWERREKEEWKRKGVEGDGREEERKERVRGQNV